MIQSYLKTGMVFYDTTDKQHFRGDCCKDTFCQFTDKDHFPSFQIFGEASIDALLGRLVRLYDLDDNLIGTFTVPDFLWTIQHAGDKYWIIHDNRDVTVYPAGFEFGVCYYLSFGIKRLDGGYDTYYSEVFKVCDCDVIGAGDGLNLIENGWFEDWSGAANPNNVPDGWTVVGNNATNYVADSTGECQMISDVTNAVRIEQTILTVGKWYVWNINVTAIPDPSIQLYNGATILLTINTLGNHSVVFQATSTVIRIYPFGITDVTFTDVRIEEFVGFAFCDMLTLNWWSDCDWDSIIYQYGYRNSLVLDIGLDSPKEDIVQNAPDERLGEKFFSDIVIKKLYRISERIPEYLWNALIRLPAYGSEMPNFHCWITLPDGSACPMSEVAILGEWDVGNCMNTFTVEFVDNDEYPVVATNCCDDEDVSEV